MAADRAQQETTNGKCCKVQPNGKCHLWIGGNVALTHIPLHRNPTACHAVEAMHTYTRTQAGRQAGRQAYIHAHMPRMYVHTNTLSCIHARTHDTLMTFEF